MKITYKTKFSYSHRIDNEPKLVDESCKENHDHKDCILTIKIPLVKDEFLDFKTVKKHVEAVLKNYKDKNITDQFNIQKTEQFVQTIKNDIEILLTKKVDVHLQETEKYGLEIVSN